MCRDNILSGMHRQCLNIGLCYFILDVTRQNVKIGLNAAVLLVVLVLEQFIMGEGKLIRQLEIWRGRGTDCL